MIIQIVEREDGVYSCRVDALFADRLTKDEALGVVASCLFGTTGKVLYVRNYEDWIKWEEKYCGLDRAGQKLLCETNRTSEL